MNMYEAAYLLWPMLVEAANNNRILPYGHYASKLGSPSARPMRSFLAPIQDLCEEKGWPPLTSIVVNKSTRKPGPGFTAWRGKLEIAQDRVFGYDWNSIKRPFSDLDHIVDSPSDQPISNFQDFNVSDQVIEVNGRGPYQSRFRRDLLDAYRNECALCDTKLGSVLVASHIVPWSLDPANRVNPQNGILLCRNHDALFESGHIEVDTDFRITIHGMDQDQMGETLFSFLTEDTAEKLRTPTTKWMPEKRFLEWRLENNRKKMK